MMSSDKDRAWNDYINSLRDVDDVPFEVIKADFDALYDSHFPQSN